MLSHDNVSPPLEREGLVSLQPHPHPQLSCTGRVEHPNDVPCPGQAHGSGACGELPPAGTHRSTDLGHLRDHGIRRHHLVRTTGRSQGVGVGVGVL